MAASRPMQAELATFPTSFRVTVQHASATRDATENIIVRVRAANGAWASARAVPAAT